MRKIERELLNAVSAMRHNNSGATWEKDNSRVTNENTAAGNETAIFLHGHNIAKISGNGSLSVCLCGWDTRTTRSRLSLLIHDAADKANAARGPLVDPVADAAGPYRYPCGLGVSSRKGVNRLHDARGETVINSADWFRVVL